MLVLSLTAIPSACLPDEQRLANPLEGVVPENLMVSFTRATSTELSWDPVSSSADRVTGYEVEGLADEGWVVIHTTSGATQYRLSGLAPETPHEFRVRAVGAGLARSDPSLSIVVTTSTLGLAEDFDDGNAAGWATDPETLLRQEEGGYRMQVGSWSIGSAYALYQDQRFHASSGFVYEMQVDSDAAALDNLLRVVFLETDADNTCHLELSGGINNLVTLRCVAGGKTVSEVSSPPYPLLDHSGTVLEIEVDPGPEVSVYGIRGGEVRTALFENVYLAGGSSGWLGVRGAWTVGYVDDVVVTLPPL